MLHSDERAKLVKWVRGEVYTGLSYNTAKSD